MNEPSNAIEIILWISGKNRFVMCNPIPEQANMRHIVPASRSGVIYPKGRVISGKNSREMMLPNGSLKPGRQHLFPKCQFQVCNDRACGLVTPCTVPQVVLGIVAFA